MANNKECLNCAAPIWGKSRVGIPYMPKQEDGSYAADGKEIGGVCSKDCRDALDAACMSGVVLEAEETPLMVETKATSGERGVAREAARFV